MTVKKEDKLVRVSPSEKENEQWELNLRGGVIHGYLG